MGSCSEDCRRNGIVQVVSLNCNCKCSPVKVDTGIALEPSHMYPVLAASSTPSWTHKRQAHLPRWFSCFCTSHRRSRMPASVCPLSLTSHLTLGIWNSTCGLAAQTSWAPEDFWVCEGPRLPKTHPPESAPTLLWPHTEGQAYLEAFGVWILKFSVFGFKACFTKVLGLISLFG